MINGGDAMKESKFTKTYFDHLTFYYEPKAVIFPIAIIIDEDGLVAAFLLWGLNWTWKRWNPYENVESE